MHSSRLSLLAGLVALTAAVPASAQKLDSLTLAGFRWRTVGPANFDGRVADIAGIPFPSKTFFVAAAGGGIWKTTNGGVTFRPVFDEYPVVSMGALAIAPSDTMQVWAGTGEQNSRNTIEPGAGIYKSTDGGITWKLTGLEKTQHIGRIAVDPTNANVVYVAALGPAWKSGGERGLYKTTDGGQTWNVVKSVSDKAGFIDVGIDPKNHNVIWASSWQRIRGPYFLTSGGPGSGLWKSTDAGSTWTEIKGGGFPETQKGRISFSIYKQNPDIVYAMIEADSNANPHPQKGQAKQKLQNGLYRTLDGGKTWTKMNDADTRPFYYSQVRVDPRDSNHVWFSSTPVLVSKDGGKTARTATQGIHVDHHAMWIDPGDPDHFVVGDDGGISITWDGGGNYDFPANLPIGQFYDVSYDFQVPYNICGGAQDNGSWCGPSKRKNQPVTNAYWYTIAGGDGFYTAQHPDEPDVVWGESQGGNISRLNVKTGERKSLVKPTWRPLYQQFEDSILVERGDTTRPLTKDQERRIAAFRAEQRKDSAEYDLRFNWETPFFLSSHNPDVFYAGGNRVLKSTNRGDDLYPISADLSKRNLGRIDTSMNKTGGITLDATGAETYGTVVALAESYVKPGWLYAGTDDGNIWTTQNDGASWEQIPTSRFPGLATGDVYVSRIEPSHFDSATFYISFDNHRWNDFTPYLYVTTDAGRTFRSIVADLPKSSVADYVHVVREDPFNRDLLYVGTSRSAYVSLDRGQSWQKFSTGFPTVPVYDLKIHPRDRDLIAATHGRGFWIVNVAALEQMAGSKNAGVIAENAHLFSSPTQFEYGQGPAMGASANGAGQKGFEVASPAYGADIVYHVGANGAVALAGNTGDAQAGQAAPPANGRAGGRGGRARGPQAQIVITDARGDTVRSLNGPATPGLHHVTWDFRGKAAPRAPLSPSAKRDSIAQTNRITFVIDSLEKAGTLPRPAAERIRQMLTSGDMSSLFGRGGGGRGGPVAGSGWNARPGEGAFVGANAPRGGEGAAAGAEESPMAMFEAFPGGMEALTELLRVPGSRTSQGRGGFGFFGGGRGAGQAPVVNTGDYLVTLKVGSEISKQVIRVERINGGEDTGFSFGTDDQ